MNKVEREILAGLTGEKRESFLEGLRVLSRVGDSGEADREAFRESVRRTHPEYSAYQVEVFVAGRENMDTGRADFIGQIANAYRELNPGASEDDVTKWVVDNEEKVTAKGKEKDMAPLTVTHLVSAVMQDEADAAKAQEIPDALAARYPNWSDEKRASWLADHEPLLLAYKGLHPEWSGTQLVAAIDD